MALVLVLAVGQDPMVLSSRCSILRSAGYLVRSSSSIGEAIDVFEDLDLDLVLLCHSIPVQDRDRLTRVIRSTGSHIPIYTVASAASDFEVGRADGIVSSRPEALITELDAVLRTVPSTAHRRDGAGQTTKQDLIADRKTSAAYPGR